jgi:hypothetical protein
MSHSETGVDVIRVPARGEIIDVTAREVELILLLLSLLILGPLHETIMQGVETLEALRLEFDELKRRVAALEAK